MSRKLHQRARHRYFPALLAQTGYFVEDEGVADNVSATTRSAIMAAVRSSGNRSTEMRMLGLLKKVGARGWRRNYPLYGRPDFVFPRLRTVIFVDGCFWHGCDEHHRAPASNSDYWMAKITRNRARDHRVTQQLRMRGWTVIRVWEHDLQKQYHAALSRRLIRLLKKNSCKAKEDFFPA
ncbi:MAG: mismatch repair protein Vsr [Verrucomicrobiales bacterium]|nr:mismatch repair protein Vsr [Verrucomicrobiales bacterium]